MNILVTGGLGYVGTTLVSHLLKKTTHRITIIDRMDYDINRNWYFETLQNQRVKIIKGDFRSVDLLYPLIKECDVVVNLAALVGEPVCEKKPDESIITNEVMVKIIGQMCNIESKKLIFLSTCSNYGQSPTPVSESSTLLPVSLYAITKVNAEKYIRKNVPGSVILRCATAYGISPGRMRWDLLLNDFVKTAVLDKNIDIFGAQAYRPLCHVEDISEAVRLVIEYDAPKKPTIFNVGSSEQNYTKEEIANTIGDLTGAKITFTDNEEKRNYMVDFTKIKKELGFTTTHTLQDGINTMANALKNKEIELVGSNV